MTIPSEPVDSRYTVPGTEHVLKREGDLLVSGEDAKEYAIRDGVPILLAFSPLETEDMRARLDALNADAVRGGWREALGAHFPEFVGYVTSSERSRYLDLLTLTPEMDVLEIGPGMGQHTRVLAPRVGHVEILEVVEGQARFTLESCRQESLGNVSGACGGDDCVLPYPAESFDVVILNLVLEWCAARQGSMKTQQETHARLMGEVERVLKIGGTFYVATKNRYALHYLLGKRDENALNIPFGNALPRFLMHFLVRRKQTQGSGEYSGFLHSYNELKRMLTSGQMACLQSFWSAPDMRNPRAYVPLQTECVREFRQSRACPQYQGRMARAVMSLIPAALVKYFTPGLVFVVQKNE
jgi:SAM-dependent methyltransferase